MSLQHWSSWWARVDYASRAAKNSLAGCFCPAGREAPGRSCSHPPAYVSLTFAQKKTASVSLHQRFFHGRGWITQAAHLKRPRRGLFAAGTYSGGPYELRLPIFLQPLGGALKNRSAAPASPPCFRRRRQSAPLLFESTRLCESDICAKENRQCISTPAVFSWARVDYASRASKKAPQGPFCRRDVWRRPMLFKSTLESETSVFYKTKSPAYFRTLSIFGGAKQPKSEPLPSGASLAAISSKVMVFVPSL